MSNKMEAYLNAEVKASQISNLKTGDLVKLQADVMPIIYHYGFIVRSGNQILFYHNQSSFKNRSGGNIIIEDFEEYAKGRKIISVKPTGLTQNEISEMVDYLKSKKYHFVNNNCEHFISKLKDGKKLSPQVSQWVFASICVGVVYLIIKDK